MIKTKYREIVTALPHKNTQKLISNILKYDATDVRHQLPIIWDSANGSEVYDVFGNKYIDFSSTIFVASAGHGGSNGSDLSIALMSQIQSLIHSYTFPTLIKDQFLGEFKKFLPSFCEKIYLASAGSEVTSWALKLMRMYGNKKLIVHIDGAFHGKTGQVDKLYEEEIKISFPIQSGQWYEDFRLLERHKDQIAGLMIESYQGWSGQFMDKDYVRNLVLWAQSNDIPVCFDEIQGGFYRTGKKFAYEHYQIKPDLICMGKGLGGGFPISALAGRKKYFKADDMSSTHSGTPLGCAAALAALKIYNKLDKKELDKKGKFLEASLWSLQKLGWIEAYNSHGLLAAVILRDKDQADNVCYECMKNGLIVVRTGKKSIKIGPPLVIPMKALDEGLNVLTEAIAKLKVD